MKITLLQIDIAWQDAEANKRKVERMIAMAEKSDVYVLPEMFTTGFVVSPAGVAENEGATLEWMRLTARQYDAAICGSVAVEERGRYYNRFYFVKPDGETVYYDKRHLFAYGGENMHYTSGDERVAVSFRGVRFLLQVCYDLRFPVFSRNDARNPYDVVLYVASWPASRLPVWNTLLHARAIENQCYVAGVNRVGDDTACHYSGGTMMVDAYGHTMAECRPDAEMAVTCGIDMAKLMSFRAKFPVLVDADSLRP